MVTIAWCAHGPVSSRVARWPADPSSWSTHWSCQMRQCPSEILSRVGLQTEVVQRTWNVGERFQILSQGIRIGHSFLEPAQIVKLKFSEFCVFHCSSRSDTKICDWFVVLSDASRLEMTRLFGFLGSEFEPLSSILFCQFHYIIVTILLTCSASLWSVFL